nr:hypothetical protein [Tanacetum cinerariifolium]
LSLFYVRIINNSSLYGHWCKPKMTPKSWWCIRERARGSKTTKERNPVNKNITGKSGVDFVWCRTYPHCRRLPSDWDVSKRATDQETVETVESPVIEGVVGLRRWIEKIEQVFEISKCAEGDKVMFAASTFEGRALTWWNGNVHTLGLANVNGIPWKKKKIERYIKGFPERIKGNINSSRPTTMHDAINMARELVEQAVQCRAIRISESNKSVRGAKEPDIERMIVGSDFHLQMLPLYRMWFVLVVVKKGTTRTNVPRQETSRMRELVQEPMWWLKIHSRIRMWSRIEQVFEISKCAEGDKVMFAASTFEGRALTWWNGNVHTLGLANVNGIPWKKKKIERYIKGFPERIKGNINSSRPTTMHDAINMARELVEQAVQCRAIRISESNKRNYKNKCPKARNQQNEGARARAYVVVENPQ